MLRSTIIIQIMIQLYGFLFFFLKFIHELVPLNFVVWRWCSFHEIHSRTVWEKLMINWLNQLTVSGMSLIMSAPIIAVIHSARIYIMWKFFASSSVINHFFQKSFDLHSHGFEAVIVPSHRKVMEWNKANCGKLNRIERTKRFHNS